MPFGISAAPEFFQRQMERILEGLGGVLCMMDDILVFGQNETEHDKRLEAVFERLKQAGLTLNKEKCEFRMNQVKFLGHIVSREGIQIDPSKVKAIQDMQPPTNKKELKSFLGMCSYLGKFSGKIAELEKPLGILQKKTSEWCWGPHQIESFEKVKKEIASAPVLAKYSLTAPHRITSDASYHTLGAAILQMNNNGEWQPVAYASRPLTDAEKRYAQIEKEALAITWACGKFDFFLVGTHFEIETDHKPLVKLLGESDIASMPLRCQKFRMRLMRYNYRIFHTPGKDMILADLLSRPAGVGPQIVKENDLQTEEVEEHVKLVTEATQEGFKDILLNQFVQAARIDPEYQLTKTYVVEGWPKDRKNLKRELQLLYSVKMDLSLHEELLMFQGRVVVPKSQRKDILGQIHVGHQGVNRCLRRARESVWWPGLSNDIKDMIKNCDLCIKYSKIEHQPLKNTELPQGPWQVVASDLMTFVGKDYLVLADYYSRWVEIALLEGQTAREIVKHIHRIFSRTGYPYELRTDNGPCYASEEFRRYCGEHQIKHTSSPLYPESNGLVERMIQSVKNWWRKEEDYNTALLMYRTTPLESGPSPAELFYNRKIRSNLPVINTGNMQEFQQNDKLLKNLQKEWFDVRKRTKSLMELQPGDRVWIRTSNTEEPQSAVVIKKSDQPDSYLIQRGDRIIRRNRKHLKKRPDNAELEGTGKEMDKDNDSCKEEEFFFYQLPESSRQERSEEQEDGNSSETEESSNEEAEVPEQQEEVNEERIPEQQQGDLEEGFEEDARRRSRRTQSGRTVRKGHLHKDCIYYT